MDTAALFQRILGKAACAASALLATGIWCATPAGAADLRVLKVGLGSGTVTSVPAGINCGTDCDESYAASVSVTLTASAAPGSAFVQWLGDCTGSAATCTLTMGVNRSVRAEFRLGTPIPLITDFTPEGLAAYLAANPSVNSPSRFLGALPAEFKQNWIMMSRSESLQTGIAEMPRFLVPSANAQSVFAFGLRLHSSYPGSHPNAIEYMQWDASDKNFRFHEIVVDPIPPMGTLPARLRGVSIDDAKCSKCHSSRNVLNRGMFPGTTGIPPGLLKAKNKPNWDSYDSWGGMLPFNRDRIYQGTVEAAAFRRIFNPWTWRTEEPIRSFIEQLELQPPGVPVPDVITRISGGTNDGRLVFSFDAAPPVLIEPLPSGPATTNVTYSFDAVAGPPPGTPVTRGGAFVTLHHSATPTNEEGRGVQLFDLLGGADGTFNQRRIADELINHRFATGSFPIDIRPVTLAIVKNCMTVDTTTDTVVSVPPAPPLTISTAFFNARNGTTINRLVTDTRSRAQDLPRRKADIQKFNLDRTGDIYLDLTAAPNGLIQQDGARTSQGTSTIAGRLRQDVFRRPIDAGAPDSTVMGGVYVDREDYGTNTQTLALLRYLLEPLGVSVDKWSMGVRGRSRTYTFADVFGTYLSTLTAEIEASLTSNPFPGLPAPYTCPSLITAVNSSLGSLPAADEVPTYTDVQRIFNKSCIECHGGLNYPPFSSFFPTDYLDLSENENPASGNRLDPPHSIATRFTTTDPATSLLFQRITEPTEECPNGVMPCGGPRLSQVDIETIRRWIVGSRPNTAGDPHVKTVNGVNYDFQSAGEFVLLRGENMELQARQTAVPTVTPLGPNPHTGLTSCVSLNTAVAMRVGPHRITYQPNLSGVPDPSGLQLRVDGYLMGPPGPGGIVLGSGGRILPTTAPGGIQVEYPGGTNIVVTPGFWEYHQLWYLNVDVRHARVTQGVIGAIAPNNWLPALPDGTFLGPRPDDLHQRYLDLYEKFADAWRVSDTSSLFDYAPGTSTATFTIDQWPLESPQTCPLPDDGEDGEGPTDKPPLPPLPLEVARQVCSGIVEDERRSDCEQDVMVTGERTFADTYLRTERIQRNRIPAAPVLLSPENDSTGVDLTVRFTWRQTVDKDRGKLRYMHCAWLTREPFTFDKCTTLAQPMEPMDDISFKLWLSFFLAALLLVFVLYVKGKKGDLLLTLLALALLAAIVLLLQLGRGGTMSHTVEGLEPGKAYFWKVVVQDGQGGTVESETRRFATKPN